jgi:hypothetical protein
VGSIAQAWTGVHQLNGMVLLEQREMNLAPMLNGEGVKIRPPPPAGEEIGRVSLRAQKSQQEISQEIAGDLRRVLLTVNGFRRLKPNINVLKDDGVPGVPKVSLGLQSPLEGVLRRIQQVVGGPSMSVCSVSLPERRNAIKGEKGIFELRTVDNKMIPNP